MRHVFDSIPCSDVLLSNKLQLKNTDFFCPYMFSNLPNYFFYNAMFIDENIMGNSNSNLC